MATIRQPDAKTGSLGRDLVYALRYYFGGRRGLLILAAVAVAGGLAFNWSWLAAVGAAPLILALAPCAVMCALGLCMNRMSGGSCKSNQAENAAAAGDETALPDGAADNLLPDDTREDVQSASVAASSRHSQPQTAQTRRTTDA
ncbi:MULTISPECIES: hypothetical protein [Alphaproteobacteria]|uniref:hypothetical protein n=1 Tax=Alphaproteobacteria TaxID=28211 RepID=UPI00326516FA